MSLFDFAQLFGLCGAVLFGISGWILLQIGAGGRTPGGVSALANKKYRQALATDLHNKKILAGGPLGLIIIMLKLGLASLLIGGLLWAIDQVAKAI